MKKNILTVLVLLNTVFAFAQTPKIPISDIQYWVGSGSNQAILIVNWCDHNVALAWGYRFNGTTTAADMLAAIDAADTRLSIDMSSYLVYDFVYQDAIYGSMDFTSINYDYAMYNVNDVMASGISSQFIANNDVMEWGGFNCSVGIGWDNLAWALPVIPVSDPNAPPTERYTIHAKSGDEWAYESYGIISPFGDSTVAKGSSIIYTFTPNAGYHLGSVLVGNNEMIGSVSNNTYTISNIMHDDTVWSKFAVDKNNTITANNILYWIGSGSNKAIFVVNWCNPEIAFAWGYRFNGEGVLVSDVMQAIKDADSRFDYIVTSGLVSQITYDDTAYNLSFDGYLAYNINEESASMIGSQYVHNNDIIEFGGVDCSFTDDFWNSVWTTAITPVSLFSSFDGIVGSEGCKAIYYEDARFIDWAATCEVIRGYKDIAHPEHGYADYGTESNAIGRIDGISTTDVVSLGDGGEAILTFQTPIANGEGYDFAVFENAMNDTFLELAFVEVSTDGIHYFRFPSTSNTPVDAQIGGSGNLDATMLNNLAGKYRIGWGTPFDLDELPDDENLDKNNIRYIKIMDVVGSINPLYATYDASGNVINDPYPTDFASGGFDLSGVGVIHNQSNVSIQEANKQEIVIYPNPATNQLTIKDLSLKGIEHLQILDIMGRTLANDELYLASHSKIAEGITMDISALPNGVYLLRILFSNKTVNTQKVVINR